MSEEHDRVVTVSILESTLKSAFNDFEKRIEKRISEEGAATRTHFNVMVERVESAVKLVAEVSSHHSTVLGDHEARLQKIERR
jgi:methyl-accepting chemotaxis protein